MRKEYFNNLAAKWDGMVSAEAPATLAAIVARSGLIPGMKVLDVGCGTGLLVPFLLDAVGAEGELVGIDFAAGMVRQAQAKGFGPNCRFLEADVTALPFGNGVFDAVFCNNALPHFPDMAAATAEMHRVLKKGGRLVICHTNGREAVNRLHHQIGGPVGEDLLPPVAELKAMLENYGFRVHQVEDFEDRFVLRVVKP